MVLFDVDGTLTPARQNISQWMLDYLTNLRTRVSVGLVGGSDLKKIAEQTMPIEKQSTCDEAIRECVQSFDYVFAENGLMAYEDGSLLAVQSIVKHLGEKKLQKFINFCLNYMSKLELPAKRGNFIELRNGLLNVCPVGRSCSQSEREQFNAYDSEHGIRAKFIGELEREFGEQSPDPLGLVFVIGGQISFDVFPKGWDKTFCLGMLTNKSFKQIHFFGDKVAPGGNDYEIFSDPRTIGHAVRSPEDTLEQLKALGL